MSRPTNSPETSLIPPGTAASTKSVHRSKSGVAGVACSVVGCLGWIGLVPFLDPCDQGEQLARFFAVLFNAILIGVVGGSATILLFVGLALSHKAMRQGDSKLGRIANAVSIVGGVVLLMNLPSILH